MILNPKEAVCTKFLSQTAFFDECFNCTKHLFIQKLLCILLAMCRGGGFLYLLNSNIEPFPFTLENIRVHVNRQTILVYKTINFYMIYFLFFRWKYILNILIADTPHNTNSNNTNKNSSIL